MVRPFGPDRQAAGAVACGAAGDTTGDAEGAPNGTAGVGGGTGMAVKWLSLMRPGECHVTPASHDSTGVTTTPVSCDTPKVTCDASVTRRYGVT